MNLEEQFKNFLQSELEYKEKMQKTIDLITKNIEVMDKRIYIQDQEIKRLGYHLNRVIENNKLRNE